MTCRRADSLAAGLIGVTCKATESHPVAAGSWGPSVVTAQRQYQSQIPTSGLGLIEKLESSEGKRLHRDLLGGWVSPNLGKNRPPEPRH